MRIKGNTFSSASSASMLLGDVGGKVQYLRSSFRFGERFQPHDFHMANSLPVLHEFEYGLVLNTIICRNWVWPCVCLSHCIFLHLVNNLLVQVYLLLHLLLYLFIVVLVWNTGDCDGSLFYFGLRNVSLLKMIRKYGMLTNCEASILFLLWSFIDLPVLNYGENNSSSCNC